MIANRPDKSKLYYPQMPVAWWFKNLNYFLFLLRELTSVFIAAFLAVYLYRIYYLKLGSGEYAEIAESFKSPGWIAFHLIALCFAVYHSVTWFKTASVIIVARVGSYVAPMKLGSRPNIGQAA